MDNDQPTTAVANRNSQTDMMVARQAQEVQVAMLAAKRFPRDELEAMNRIKATCQRPSLAEQAVYTYPRGGQKVSGPSIRLAEALAQNWGNIDSGIIELENRNGKSEMMAYAWDLETNTRSTKTFSVEHKRDTKQGSYELTDSRDVYEATANFGARRMRACILSVIPGDVVDMAVAECRKTLADKDKRPLSEILTELVKAFKSIGVSKQQLERYMDKQLPELLKEDLVDLRGIYKAIKEGQSKKSDFFKDLDDVGADNTEQDDIVAAQQEGSDDAPAYPKGKVDEEAEEAEDDEEEQPDSPPGENRELAKAVNKSPDAKPNKSVKEMAEERGWTGKGKQASLVDDQDS